MPALIVMTGATSGIGLEAARALGARGNIHLIVGARVPERADALREAVRGARLTVLPLNTASLASVRAFAAGVLHQRRQRPISALALNAGMQSSDELQLTDIGVEKTFATNCLGHFALAEQLKSGLALRAAVVITASQSHHPSDRIAKLLGYRGAIFPGAEAVVRGELDNSAAPAQAARDRYATSKLCCLLWTFAMARRARNANYRFLAYDPGTVPGTGIARELGFVAHFGWRRLLPLVVPLLPSFTNPPASGRALAHLLMSPSIAVHVGQYIDHRLLPAAFWAEAKRIDWQDDLLAVCTKLTARD